MRACPVDGKPIEGRADKLYCSEKCSKRARRSGAVVALRPPGEAGQAGHPSLADSTRAELAQAGRETSGLGASALLLAARIDSGSEPGSALAALNRELRATLAEALRGEQKSSVSAMRDELAERRARA